MARRQGKPRTTPLQRDAAQWRARATRARERAVLIGDPDARSLMLKMGFR